jgi:peptidoglycan/LPS O-acetylase OafA/YrhL
VKSQAIVEDPSRYLESIQAGRGIAALLVVVHHAAQKAAALSNGTIPSFDFGIVGVDLFFMISGFIIYFVTVHKPATHAEFFEKRLVRIFPLYWGLSLLALAIFLVKPGLINSNASAPTDVAASFLLWPTAAPYLVNNGWTLTYEVLFYILWGLVALPMATDRRAVVACALLLVVAVAGPVMAVDPKVLNLSLFVEFAAGVLTGVAFHKRWLRPNRGLSALLLLVGTVLAFVAVEGGMSNSPLRGFVLLVPVAMMFLGIVLAGPLWRSTPWMLRIGDSSYSLYLFHPFILVLIPIAVRLTGLQHSAVAVLLIALAGCVAAVAFSFLLYKLVELPMTNWLRRWVGRVGRSSRLPA